MPHPGNPKPCRPCRVLANNDVPTGAARIPLEATLPADWEGWTNMPAAPAEELPLLPAPAPVAPPRAKRARATPRRPRSAAAAPKPGGGSGDSSVAEQPKPGSSAKPGSSGKRRPKAAAGAPAGKAAASVAAGGGDGSLAGCGSMGTAEPLREQQGSTPRVVVLSESAWKVQQQQLGALQGLPTIHLALASGSTGRGAPRSFSVPPAAAAQRPQSHWQVQQQRMAAQAGSGDGTTSTSGEGRSGSQQPGMFAARSLATSGPSASQQPTPASTSPRTASLANDLSPFALAAAQASAAMAEGASSAWPHLPQQQQQMGAGRTPRSTSGHQASLGLDPLAGASVAPSRSPRGQEWVAYSHPMPASLAMPAGMLAAQLGSSDASSALYYPGAGLMDRAALLQRQVEAGGFGPSIAVVQAVSGGGGGAGWGFACSCGSMVSVLRPCQWVWMPPVTLPRAAHSTPSPPVAPVPCAGADGPGAIPTCGRQPPRRVPAHRRRLQRRGAIHGRQPGPLTFCHQQRPARWPAVRPAAAPAGPRRCGRRAAAIQRVARPSGAAFPVDAARKQPLGRRRHEPVCL